MFQLDVALTNHGSWVVPATVSLSVLGGGSGGSFSGAGVLEFGDYSSATIANVGQLSLDGTVSVATLTNIVALEVGGHVSVGTLTNIGALVVRGTLTVTSSFTLPTQTTLDGTLIGTFTVPAGATLTVAGSDAVVDGGVTNNGTLVFSAPGDFVELVLQDASVLTNNGSISVAANVEGFIEPAGSGAGSVVNNAAGTVSLGSGSLFQLDVALTNSGKINVGTGSLSLSGDFQPASTATLAVTMSAAGHGSVSVGGTTKLAGKLAITTAAGYTPASGTSATILTTSGAQSGSFATVTGQTITASTGWKVNVAAPTVKLVVGALGPIPSAPTNVTAVPGNSTATVSWTAASGNGSAVTTYIVTPFLAGTAQTSMAFNSSATTETITGLTNAKSYTFKVAAENANGIGPQSAASSPIVVGSPVAPTGVTATAGSGQATLHWTAPAASNGSAISGYVVTPFLLGAAQPTITFNSTATTETATGLTAGKSYTFTVAAKNSSGIGPSSLPSNAVSPT